ncbi:MAG: hypothetical protein K6E85_09075 [Lachnospiraceae bacterium]|nr:hypothetical protein [Lachnospiraceae bacterium]
MTRKLLSFLTALWIILASFAPGDIRVYAADTDLTGSSQVSEEYTVEEVAGELEDAESILPVGGVSESVSVEIDWNDEWDSLINTKKRGGTEIIETKDPDGAYTSASDGSGSYGYKSLSDKQKAVYDKLKTVVNDFIKSDAYKQDLTLDTSGIVSVTTPSDGASYTTDDMHKARTAFLYDNPQYFFLSSTYSYSFKQDGSLMLGLFVDDYYFKYAVRKEAQDAITDIGNEWINNIKSIKSSKGDYQAAVYAHNLIIDRINYAYDGGGNPQKLRWAHQMSGVFTGQGVVCEGYARAYQYLLNMCGIDNVYIVGMASGGGSGSGGHAWNCIYIDSKWYPVDVTWDDLGKDSNHSNDMWYTYFAVSGTKFNKDHNANNMGQPGMYTIPAFSTSDDHSYYIKFNGYGNNSITDEASAQNVYNAAGSSKPGFTNYLYFSVADTQQFGLMQKVAKTQLSGHTSSHFGIVFRIEYIDDISKPAEEITLSKSEVTVDIGSSVEVTAILPEGSNDRVSFSLDSNKYCTIKVDKKTVTITGRKNGKAVLLARTVAGKAEATCEITIGTGSADPEEVSIWQNGGKEYKKIQLKTTLKATSWKDSKGKSKHGKLVWIASDEDITIEFDSDKHKVTTKTKPTKGSVTNKGIVTAKTAGTLFVYCCDTGSFDVEKFVVEVLASPSKLFLGEDPTVTESKDALKKLVVNVGETEKVYICPFVKDGAADEANEYTVTVPKSGQSKYVSLSSVKSDGKGGIYFTVTGVDYDRSKKKPASVKIVVQCKQSGKKASLSVGVCNPVQEADVSNISGKTILAKKKDSANMKLNLTTCLNGVSATTDKLKVYVGNTEVELDDDEKKVSADGGATVKAKFDAKSLKLTLTAGQDAGETAVVYLAATDPKSKKTALFLLLEVDEEGKITVNKGN